MDTVIINHHLADKWKNKKKMAKWRGGGGDLYSIRALLSELKICFLHEFGDPILFDQEENRFLKRQLSNGATYRSDHGRRRRKRRGRKKGGLESMGLTLLVRNLLGNNEANSVRERPMCFSVHHLSFVVYVCTTKVTTTNIDGKSPSIFCFIQAYKNAHRV